MRLHCEIRAPLDTSDWPLLKSALTDRAWCFMTRHAADITAAVLRFADALALGGEIRPGHLALAIRRQRRGAPLPIIHEETTCAN